MYFLVSFDQCRIFKVIRVAVGGVGFFALAA